MIHIRGKPRSKYGNKKVELDGFKFDSKKEANRYRYLLQLQGFGEITALMVHPKWELKANGQKICSYIADFSYAKGEKYVVEDVKGVKTAVYQLKKKLMAACHGISIVEV